MLDERYRSKTFEKVNDPACGLYYQGAVYVFQFLKNEIECAQILPASAKLGNKFEELGDGG